MPVPPRYLSADEAARELGVSLATLYAYVSRGMVRSEAGTGRGRARRYHAEDVQRLKERREQRRDPERAARTALHLGAPVLDSALTRIEAGRFYYRGHDAAALAGSRTLEEVAALLWTGGWETGEVFAPAALPPGGPAAAFDPAHPVESFQRALLDAATTDPHAYDLRPRALARTGARIVRLLAAAAAGGAHRGEPVAETLRRAWAPDRHAARPLLDAALVLCADHELTVPAFTARCAASAGATPYGAAVAGLAALGGVRQGGGEVERVAALFDEAARPEGARAALASRLRRGEGVPGFGQPLYPEGDPRAPALLEHVRAAYPDGPALALADALAEAALESIGERPVLDFGLVTLARALGLPDRSALALYALGRTVGLVGHAMEQYAAGRAIRPRARYTGPPVG